MRLAKRERSMCPLYGKDRLEEREMMQNLELEERKVTLEGTLSLWDDI